MQEWMLRNDTVHNTGAASLLPATRPHTMYYREALTLIEENIKQHKNDLVKDNLYSTALVLKALCLWKLDKPAELDATIREARKVRSSFLTEQWQLLVLSKKFLEADHAAALVRQYDAGEDIPLEVYTEVRNTLFDKANGVDKNIEDALSEPVIANNLPLKRYLLSARITIHKNYTTACKYLATPTDEQSASLDEKENILAELKGEFNKLPAVAYGQ